MSGQTAELVGESKLYEWWMTRSRLGSMWEVKSWAKTDPSIFTRDKFATQKKAREFGAAAARAALDQGA